VRFGFFSYKISKDFCSQVPMGASRYLVCVYVCVCICQDM
jgi:hypothetical protein